MTRKPEPEPTRAEVIVAAMEDSMAREVAAGRIPAGLKRRDERTAPVKTEDFEERRSGEDRRQDDGRIKFDRTINLGHVLTLIGLLGALVVGWNVMDKRVVVLEEARIAQRERDQAQDAVSRDKFQEVRDALIDLRRSIEKVSDKVGAK